MQCLTFLRISYLFFDILSERKFFLKLSYDPVTLWLVFRCTSVASVFCISNLIIVKLSKWTVKFNYVVNDMYLFYLHSMEPNLTIKLFSVLTFNYNPLIDYLSVNYWIWLNKLWTELKIQRRHSIPLASAIEFIWIVM